MTRLKKLLITLLLSTISLVGTISVYGVSSNPYSSSLDSSTTRSLDGIIDLVERKGQSLSTQSYYNLISALSNRLRYLDYELLSIRATLGLGGNNNGGTTTITTCEWGYRGVSPAPPAPARDCICGETINVGGGVYECYEKTTTVPVTNPTPITPISNPYPPVNCDSNNVPTGLSMLNGSYKNLNDNYSFGETTHTDVLVNLKNTEYIAISGFGTTKTNFRRRIDFVTPPTNYNKAKQSTISISECPGDFSATAVCTKTIQAFQSMRFSTNSNDDPNFYCILDPTKTYYMNIVNSPDPLNTESSCLYQSDNQCAIFYTETTN